MGASEMKAIANWMADVIEHPDDEASIARTAGAVRELCDKFPAPGIELH
jgi:glycine hydroxymethyltransferase